MSSAARRGLAVRDASGRRSRLGDGERTPAWAGAGSAADVVVDAWSSGSVGLGSGTPMTTMPRPWAWTWTWSAAVVAHPCRPPRWRGSCRDGSSGPLAAGRRGSSDPSPREELGRLLAGASDADRPGAWPSRRGPSRRHAEDVARWSGRVSGKRRTARMGCARGSGRAAGGMDGLARWCRRAGTRSGSMPACESGATGPVVNDPADSLLRDGCPCCFIGEGRRPWRARRRRGVGGARASMEAGGSGS